MSEINPYHNHLIEAICDTRRYSVHDIMRIIERDPQSVSQKGRRNNDRGVDYPLHNAISYYQCRHESTLEDVIMILIALYPEAVSYPCSYHNLLALHLACNNPNTISERVMKRMIELYPIALQQPDNLGLYPIHHMLWNDYSMEFLSFVISTDRSVLQQRSHQPDYPQDWTTLHHACHQSRTDFVTYLFDCFIGAVDVNAQDDDGNTPLHTVCQRCLPPESEELDPFDITIVRLLLNQPDINISIKNRRQETPLHIIEQKIVELRDRIIEYAIEQQFDDDNQIWNNEEARQFQMVLYETKTLFEQFPIQRKWQAFQYFYGSMDEYVGASLPIVERENNR